MIDIIEYVNTLPSNIETVIYDSEEEIVFEGKTQDVGEYILSEESSIVVKETVHHTDIFTTDGGLKLVIYLYVPSED